MMSPIKDENRDLRKQIGCMNGIFQIFDRHHFLTGRRVSSSYTSKRMLQGGKHQMDQQYATKSAVEKGVEVQKEKPRMSTESSRASFSSSSCSSTFSSLDCNRTIQPETLSLRQISIPEIPFQTTAASKERQPSSTKGARSHDLRAVVKDSMHREVRSLSIKPQSNDERRGTVMKHIDSPRPLQPSKTERPKAATGHAGAPRALAKVQDVTKNSKDERLTLPRFSYDGRESRDMYKSAMKHKELPRLSLDSKTNSMKTFESRLNFLGRELHVENENSSRVLHSNQEPGSHNRSSSSVVARLMGLDVFPVTISTDESRTPAMKSCIKEAFLSQLSSTAEDHSQNRVNYSPRVSQNSPASPSSQSHSVNPARKPTTFSRFPVEPAPWRQQDPSQGSPKMASKSRKAATSTLHQTSSVYGQIEKRITELEFKKSGKDLRALKQILEAMQKTRERMEDQRGESAELTPHSRCSLEESCPHQNSKLAMWKNKKAFHQVPAIKEPCSPKQFDSVVAAKPAKAMEKFRLSISTRVSTAETTHLQNLQTRTPKYHRGSSAHSQKANNLTPENRNVQNHSRHLQTQRMKLENNTTPGRSSGAVSPRLQQNSLRIEAESGRGKKHGSKKLVEKGSQSRKNKVKAKDQQLSDDQLSELSSDTRYSSYQGDTASVVSESNSLVSQSETEVTSLAHSINTDTRQDKNLVSTTRAFMPAVESAVTMLEQPSPISVLDNTFYCEDSPSPVKKISTVFQEDESPCPDEAEWCLQNLNHLIDCARLTHSFKYNQKLESMRNSVQELPQLRKEPDDESLNPDHRYINKILSTSGLLKDSSFISTTDKLFSSHHLINPDMFHVLEQTEGLIIEKNDKLKLDNKRVERKMVFDLVDEILVRKISSSRLFTAGKKQTSPQGLLKEVHLEMERLRRIPDSNLDEEDEMIRLLAAGMMHQPEDWVDYSGEVPALVLDIERQIFKDLINEVITGEVMDTVDRPKRHCRKLFGK
ncbi:hypothetical protein C2S52_002415 [Perilla frutescens var. hirtella]|nr:hypothetical protein C2S52_002415 [Perilla frutescens var. hirtella]